MRNVLLISILSAFLLSCEKEAYIPIPDQEAKLAVSCFISPGDTAVDVFVYLSEPVFAVHDPNAGVMQNATVVFSNGSVSIPVPYNSNFGTYHLGLASFPVGYNTTYYLTVSDAQGRQVTTKTTTPSAAFPAFEASQDTRVNANNNPTYEVTCKITDIIGEENYYRILCAKVSYDSIFMDTTIYGEGMDVFLNDHTGDGNTSVSQIPIYNHASADTSTSYRARRVTVVKCNKDYYNFHSSISKANNSNGNPFAEPVIIYSNVEGGYGCFGAYVMQHKDIPY
jgi:hypothetical protein